MLINFTLNSGPLPQRPFPSACDASSAVGVPRALVAVSGGVPDPGWWVPRLMGQQGVPDPGWGAALRVGWGFVVVVKVVGP